MSKESKLKAIESKIETYEKAMNPVMFFLLCVLGIIAIWLIVPSILYGMVAYRYPNGEIPSQIGVVGDFFGSVNALFAGLAFLLILITVRQGQKNLEAQRESLLTQQRELCLQREELQESRKVLAEQANAQQNMNKALSKLTSEMRMSSLITGLSALATADSDVRQKTEDQLKLRAYIEHVNRHAGPGYCSWDTPPSQ